MAGVGHASHEHLAAKQMLAGALADGTMYPMMTATSRLQVQGGSRGGTAAMYMYRGPVQAIQTIFAKERWRTFYKGYATVTQVAPAHALYFVSYQAIKRYLPGGRDSPVLQFGGGAMASLVQSTVAVPVEVIRRRQMVQTSGEGSYTVTYTHLVHPVGDLVTYNRRGKREKRNPEVAFREATPKYHGQSQRKQT